MNFAVGDLVTTIEFEHRTGANDVCYRTVAYVKSRIELRHDPCGAMLILKPLRRFCWVDNYHEHGRFLPPLQEDAAYESQCAPLFYDTRL